MAVVDAALVRRFGKRGSASVQRGAHGADQLGDVRGAVSVDIDVRTHAQRPRIDDNGDAGDQLWNRDAGISITVTWTLGTPRTCASTLTADRQQTLLEPQTKTGAVRVG